MDFKQVTEEYYSLWLGEENILCGYWHLLRRF